MDTDRRRLLGAFACAGGFRRTANAQETGITIDVLRGAATVHGNKLSDARLEIIKPALERRLSELRALRALGIDDRVGPTQGILAE
jgi:hypothetical protein